MGRRRNGQKGKSLPLHKGAEPGNLLFAGNVALVAQHQLLARGKLRRKALQLCIDGGKIFFWVPPFAARYIHHMQQHAAALYMAQKIVPQAHAVGRALNQARNVGRHKAGLGPHAHHAQHGRKRGEVVIGYFGLCGADGADERRFAHIGKANQPHVGNQLQLQLHLQLFAGQAGLGKARNLPRGRGKVHVAPAALAALCHHHGLVGRDVGNDKAAFGLFHQRAARHADDKVLRVFSVAARAAAVFAARRRILALIAEIHQGGKVWVGHKHNVAAAPAVAAVRPAGRHIFFPVERNGAVAALARLQEYFCGVDKHSFLLFSIARRYGKSRAAARPGFTRFLLLDADLLAVAAHALERDAAVHKGEQRVVAAASHVLTRMDVCAALAHQNVAGKDELAVAALHAQALRFRIAAVFRRAYAFFMCHILFPSPAFSL